MDKKKIEKVQKLNTEIENFRDLYLNMDLKLWSDMGTCVSADTLLAFLIENPCFQKIADKVKKLDNQ